MSRPPAPPSRPEAKYRTSPRWATNGQPSRTAELSSALVRGWTRVYRRRPRPGASPRPGRRRQGEAEATSCTDQPPDGAHRLSSNLPHATARINWRSSIDRPAAAAHSPIGVFTRATRGRMIRAPCGSTSGLCGGPGLPGRRRRPRRPGAVFPAFLERLRDLFECRGDLPGGRPRGAALRFDRRRRRSGGGRGRRPVLDDRTVPHRGLSRPNRRPDHGSHVRRHRAGTLARAGHLSRLLQAGRHRERRRPWSRPRPRPSVSGPWSFSATGLASGLRARSRRPGGAPAAPSGPARRAASEKRWWARPKLSLEDPMTCMNTSRHAGGDRRPSWPRPDRREIANELWVSSATVKKHARTCTQARRRQPCRRGRPHPGRELGGMTGAGAGGSI